MGSTRITLLKQSRPGKFNPVVAMKAYKEDIRICVITTLNEYIARTKDLWGSETFLLISFVNPHKRISRDTLSRWVSVVLDCAGIDTSRFKAHSTRPASTSAAKRNSVNIDDILRTAGWSPAGLLLFSMTGLYWSILSLQMVCCVMLYLQSDYHLINATLVVIAFLC